MGTYGVGLASQIVNFSTVIVSIGAFGVPMGLTKYVSEWEKDGEIETAKKIVCQFIVILFLAGILFTIASIVFSSEISMFILDSGSFASYLIISFFAFPLLIITSIFEAYIRGLKKFNQYVKLSVAASLASLTISVICVFFWGILGVSIYLVISSVAGILIFIVFFKRTGFLSLSDFNLKLYPLSDFSKSIFKIGAAGLIDMAMAQVTLLLIRSLIVQYFGIDTNGIYQTIFAISNNYLSLFIMSLFIYVVPILSEMKSPEEMNREINNVCKFSLFVVFPVIIFTFTFREIVISLLYSQKFSSASNFIVYQFIGDYIKAISWVLGSWFIPRAKLKMWLSLGLIFNLSYLIIFLFFKDAFFFDLRSVVISYAFANVFHLIATVYYSKKVNLFKFTPEVLRLLVITTLFLIVILLISSFNIIWGYIAIIPLFAVWIKLCLKKSELIKLLELAKMDSLIKLLK